MDPRARDHPVCGDRDARCQGADLGWPWIRATDSVFIMSKVDSGSAAVWRILLGMSSRHISASAAFGAVVGAVALLAAYLMYRLVYAWASADSLGFLLDKGEDDLVVGFLCSAPPACFLAGFLTARALGLAKPKLTTLIALAASFIVLLVIPPAQRWLQFGMVLMLFAVTSVVVGILPKPETAVKPSSGRLAGEEDSVS